MACPFYLAEQRIDVWDSRSKLGDLEVLYMSVSRYSTGIPAPLSTSRGWADLARKEWEGKIGGKTRDSAALADTR